MNAGRWTLSVVREGIGDAKDDADVDGDGDGIGEDDAVRGSADDGSGERFRRPRQV